MVFALRFIEQLDRDTRFLRQLGIVDYSILVGIQPNQASTKKTVPEPDADADADADAETEKRASNRRKFAHLVSSMKRSDL